MLAKFAVSNFKNFADTFSFDFTNTKQYDFNGECVTDGIVSKALIYGHNGVGKSNLGFAIFDLISHLTSHHSSPVSYKHYLNALSDGDLAEFSYQFQFGAHIVEYSYGKSSKRALVYERLSVDGQSCIAIDRRVNSVADITLEGTESLKSDLGESKISVISYVKNNAVLAVNPVNRCFERFVQFVDGMLFFRSLDNNGFIGLQELNDDNEIASSIVDNGKLADFQSFLNDAGIECELTAIENTKGSNIAFVFEDKQLPFYDIASTGTRSLALFYYWMQKLGDPALGSFVFIDEFDAFYHHSLSELIIQRLRDAQAQVVITTHNTSSMTNDLLRPDCYFLMTKRTIKSLAHCTRKELRFAHNIEKMYKAGAFDV